MAHTARLVFTQNTDIETGVVEDTSHYGGSDPARSARANYLLWSKTDKNGTRAFDNPSSGNVLSTLTYTVNTPEDGYYEGILMRFDLYDNGQAYVAGDAVYYLGSVYTALGATTGNLPTDTNFWSAAITDLSTLIANTSVDVFIADFYIKVRSSQCLNTKLLNYNGGNGCGCNGSQDFLKMRTAMLVKYKIMAADAAFANDEPEQMEKIIREIESTCETC